MSSIIIIKCILQHAITTPLFSIMQSQLLLFLSASLWSLVRLQRPSLRLTNKSCYEPELRSRGEGTGVGGTMDESIKASRCRRHCIQVVIRHFLPPSPPSRHPLLRMKSRTTRLAAPLGFSSPPCDWMDGRVSRKAHS